MYPSRNPNCQRYIDDPNYAWYGGQWVTLEYIERHREQCRIENLTQEQIERKREQDREWWRERYWGDPVFRVEKNIKTAANRNLRKRRELHGN